MWTDVDGLARGGFDPLSVVVLLGHDRPAHAAPLSWGLPSPPSATATA